MCVCECVCVCVAIEFLCIVCARACLYVSLPTSIHVYSHFVACMCCRHDVGNGFILHIVMLKMDSFATVYGFILHILWIHSAHCTVESCQTHERDMSLCLCVLCVFVCMCVCVRVCLCL